MSCHPIHMFRNYDFFFSNRTNQRCTENTLAVATVHAQVMKSTESIVTE
jgi:hypothetical protein